MQISVELHRKLCRISLSQAAEKALSNLNAPMLVEMEVTLACMVKKRVHFRENDTKSDAISVTDRLLVRVISGEHCSAVSSGKDLPPVVNWGALIPKWLKIDYRYGKWSGDFGYDAASAGKS